MPGAPGYQRKTKCDFKGMDKFIKKYNKELDLYVEVRFQRIQIWGTIFYLLLAGIVKQLTYH